MDRAFRLQYLGYTIKLVVRIPGCLQDIKADFLVKFNFVPARMQSSKKIGLQDAKMSFLRVIVRQIHPRSAAVLLGSAILGWAFSPSIRKHLLYEWPKKFKDKPGGSVERPPHSKCTLREWERMNSFSLKRIYMQQHQQ